MVYEVRKDSFEDSSTNVICGNYETALLYFKVYMNTLAEIECLTFNERSKHFTGCYNGKRYFVIIRKRFVLWLNEL